MSRSKLDSAADRSKQVAEVQERLVRRGKRRLYDACPRLEAFATAGRGQVDAVVSVVILATVALVGILIYSQVESSMPLDVSTARNDPANATTLENASAGLGDGFGDAMDLLPIVLITLIAGVVISIIGRFRMRS